MSELWFYQRVSPAPGKGIKGEQGLGGQDWLEKRSPRPQQGNSGHSHVDHVHFCLWFVALSRGTIGGRHEWDHRDKELRREWEGDATQC